MTTLSPGDKAPAFTLLDQHDEKVKLSDLKGRKVLVYFYPKADTPGCTTQACGIRDNLPEFEKLDAVVIGVSKDPIARHEKFIKKYDLNFAAQLLLQTLGIVVLGLNWLLVWDGTL